MHLSLCVCMCECTYMYEYCVSCIADKLRYVQCEACDEHMVETMEWFDADRPCRIRTGLYFSHRQL